MKVKFTMIIIVLVLSFPFIGRAYTPPIGIPMPTWGIDEAIPEPPSTWNVETPGYYYVDSSIGCSNSSTIYGHKGNLPGSARCYIPDPIPAGSYVEVHNTYNYAIAGIIKIHGNGTSGEFTVGSGVANARTGNSGPVWIVGNVAPVATFTSSSTSVPILVFGSYVYIDSVKIYKSTISIGSSTVGRPANHIMVRNSEMIGDAISNSGGMKAIGSSTDNVSNVIVYNNVIHDFGLLNTVTDNMDSAAGIQARAYSSYVWILENTMYNMGGQGIPVGGQFYEPKDICHHIFAGRNIIYGVSSSGMAVKRAQDVVFSENHIYGTENTQWSDTSWSPGKGIAGQYSPDRLWILFNRIHGFKYGIYLPSADAGISVYIIGNLIYDINPSYHCNYSGCTDDNYDGLSIYDEAAILTYGPTYSYIVNNTIYDVSSGVLAAASGVGSTNQYIENNIIAEINQPNGRHIWVSGTTTTTTVRNNIISQNLGIWKITWGDVSYTTLAGFQTATGKGEGCSMADPVFLDKLIYDLRIRSNSQAKDNALPPPHLTSNVYATFSSLYNLDIEKDINNISRPQGGHWDIGAYESIRPSPPLNLNVN